MPAMQVRAVVEGVDAAAALRLVTDYRRWPDASDTIRSVQVEETGRDVSVSIWEVTFRGGLMRWSERDWFDPEALEQRFALIDGDPHDFAGAWSAAPCPDGCVLLLKGEFDLGMPSLRHVLDPIAIEALEDAVADVLHALFGRIRVDPAEPVAR